MISPVRPRLIKEPVTQVEVERLALILEAKGRERRANRLLLIIVVTFLSIMLGLMVVASISNV